MELSKLRELVSTLRALGVTKYKHEGTEIELGIEPAATAPIDLNREGFTPTPERSPALTNILARLDPQYSDPALFEIK